MTRFLRRKVGLTNLGWVLLFVTLALLGAASASLARAQEGPDGAPRFEPSSRAGRDAANGAALLERRGRAYFSALGKKGHPR